MRRRQFVFTAATFALLNGCGVLPSLVKAPGSGLSRVGILDGPVQNASNAAIAGLKQRMAELGYVDGRNISYEQRDSDGWDAQLSSLAHESTEADAVVRLPVG